MKNNHPQILGLIGSPRKNGNTQILMEKTLEGARQQWALTETLFLRDLTIQECNGCHACWLSGKCSKNDDMNRIYPKIIQSEFLILGSPVYWYGPTALMKGFVDRLTFFNCEANRKGIRAKKGVIIIPFEERNLETAEPLISFFEKALDYLEMKLAGKLIVPGVTQKGEVLRQEKIMQEAYELGQELAR